MWAALADKRGSHFRVLILNLAVAALMRMSLLLPPLHAAPALFAAVVCVQAIDAPVQPLIDNGVLNLVAPNTLLFGQQRLWGAVGFGLTALTAGTLAEHTPLGFTGAFLVQLACAAIALAFVSRFAGPVSAGRPALLPARTPRSPLPSRAGDTTPPIVDGPGDPERGSAVRGEPGELMEVEMAETDHDAARAPAGVAAPNVEHQRMLTVAPSEEAALELEGGVGGEAVRARSVWARVLAVARHPPVACFFLVVWACGCATGVIETFLYVVLGDMGAGTTLMGVARLLTCASELPVFFYAGPFIRRVGFLGALHGVSLAYVVRLGWYAVLRDPWWVLPAEVLHGITYALMWSACTAFAHRVAPPGLGATMQGLLSGVHFGLGVCCGALLGGLLYSSAGRQVLFATPACMMAAVFVGLGVLRCRERAKGRPFWE